MKKLHITVISGTEELFLKINDTVKTMGIYVDYAENADKVFEKTLAENSNVAVIDINISNADLAEKKCKKLIESGIFDYVLTVTNKKTRKRILDEELDIYRNLDAPLDGKEFLLALNDITRVEKLKNDVLEKEKRLLHLDVINEIARKSLCCLDEKTLLWDLAGLIHEKLNLFNVNIFLVAEDSNRLVLKAFAGGFGDDLVVGYNLRFGEGITGWAAQNRQSMVSSDVKNDPRRIQGFAFENSVLSELAVPIIYEDKVLGVLHVESCEKDAFSPEDLKALETVADQMSLAFENLRLISELIGSKKLIETINDSLPVSIVILDHELNIEHANMTFCEINNLKKEEILKQPFKNFLSDNLLKEFDFENELHQIIDHKISITHSNIRHLSPYHADKILNITFTYVEARQQSRIMVLIQDVTEYTKKTYQLSMLREISLAMKVVLERDKLLHLILTCVTAGFAIGFNRAFLFLVSDDRNILHGIMGVGPTSQDEAYRIWNELSLHTLTFKDYLEKVKRGELAKSSIQALIEDISFDLKSSTNILIDTVTSAHYHHVLNAWDNPMIDEKMKKFLVPNEFVTIPLIVKNKVIGVLFADNAFSGRTITQESIDVLTMFAGSAAIAIENAKNLEVLEEKIDELQKANIELAKAQDIIIKNERLAAIGEISARLAHEIRNPLSTIGGFAKLIPKKYDDRERTIKNAKIIIEEVGRLEHILTNVLEFSKQSAPKKALKDVNELIKETVSMLEGTFISNRIVVVFNFEQEKLEAELDSVQIKQVLINVIQNGLYAMPEGGALEIKTSADDDTICIDIIDTGRGIPSDYIETIFEPFFTTRANGTGLGLPISHIIIQNHNGNIIIDSKEGKGTTVSIFLPKKR